MEIFLGYAPAGGNDSVTQCLFFKTLVRNHCGRDPDGAFLKTMIGKGKSGMSVEFEPEIPGAMAWAKRVEEMAERTWFEIEHGKKPEVKITIRR